MLEYFNALLSPVGYAHDIPDCIKDDRKAEVIALYLQETRRVLASMKSGEDSPDANSSMAEQFSAALKKLRKEEERWRLAIFCSNNAVWELSLDSSKLPYYSPRVFELLGISQKNAPLISSWPKLFHPKDHESLALYRRFVTMNNPPHIFELDHRLRCSDGSYRWFMTRGMTVFDPIEKKPMRIIGVTADIHSRKEREEYFSFRATHDVLTGLPNRLLFDEHLKNGMALTKRDDSRLAVVMVDLDKFKYINDTFGHEAGDHVLREVASRLKRSLRESDMASRFGGDEFAMILAFGRNEWQAIDKIVQRAMLALKEHILISGEEVFVTASFGIAIYPNDGMLAKTLMTRADEAMYYAKALGRNACVFWKRDKRFDVVRLDSDTLRREN